MCQQDLSSVERLKLRVTVSGWSDWSEGDEGDTTTCAAWQEEMRRKMMRRREEGSKEGERERRASVREREERAIACEGREARAPDGDNQLIGGSRESRLVSI